MVLVSNPLGPIDHKRICGDLDCGIAIANMF
jgi:hypothetical protein